MPLFLLFASIGAYCEKLSIPREKAYQDLNFGTDPGDYKSFIINPIPSDWKEMSLDGIWKFKNMPFKKNSENPLDDEGMKNAFFKSGYDDKSWEETKVPWSWYFRQDGKRDDKLYTKGKLGWYRRSFDLNKEQLSGNRRVVLDIRRAADQVDIWINGQKAGERHTGRFDSFQYDITALLKEGNNTIAIRVYDYVGHENFRLRRAGGLYHPVRLIFTPSQIYGNKLKITSHFDKKEIEIDAELVNSSDKALDVKLTVELANWDDKKIQDKTILKSVTLEPGRHWVELGKIKLKNPVGWTPDNPHLYSLRLNDEKGNSIAFARFGFRDFLANGDWLYLNGEKFKPRAFTFDYCTQSSSPYYIEKLLRYMKSLGINMIRVHSKTGIPPETFYHLCDSLGIVLYHDWSGPAYTAAFDKKWKDTIMEMWPSYKEHILDYYSHPSICMWSFGNEIYEGHEGISFCEKLDRQYGLVKEIDKQNRPICTSSGRHTLGAVEAGLIKERTDVLDDHQYKGAVCGSWQANIAHINAYAEAALKAFKTAKPKIDCEYGTPGDDIRYRAITFSKVYPVFKLDPSNPEFKKQYLSFLTDKSAEIGGFIRGKMNYASPRIYVTDETECRRLYGEKYVKRFVEIYRRAGTKCIGGHTNASWYDLVKHSLANGGTSAFYGIPGPIDVKKDIWVSTPLANTLKRIYSPLLVSAGVFNQHPVPGAKEKIDIFVTNDLNESADFKVIPQIKFENEKPIVFPAIEFGKLQGMEQKSLDFSYNVPAATQTKRGNLELFLFKNGKRVNDNLYPLTIAAENKNVVNANNEAALYDSAETLFKGLVKDTTTRALKSLGIKVQNISTFDDIEKYKYIIIGTSSFDKKLIDAGEKIYNWVKKGGKLLCFEQNFCGKIPFYPNYSITAGTPSTYVSLSVINHPVFNGLAQEDFDSWAGYEGTMFDYALMPLNEGFVAVSPTASQNDIESIKPVLADVKLGKGEIIFSQISATKRINTDSVSRAYLKNILDYFMADGVQKFAYELPEEALSKPLYVEDKDAFMVDLRKFANRSFRDDTPAGDKQGGWADYGPSDFRDLTPGTQRYAGVPFNIIDPEKNNGNGCIVMKGKNRDYFPDKIKGIPVDAKLNVIYLLHTAMYAKPGNSVKYTFNYKNGEKREFIATTEKDIPDWHNPKNRQNAIVALNLKNKGLYLTEFINPLPKVPVKTIDIESYGESIPIILAITGKKRFDSVIAGVGEE